MDIYEFQVHSQSKKNNQPTQEYAQERLFRIKLSKIGIIILSLPICILVIYVLSVSVNYFQLLFSLTNQLTAKQYLRAYYTSYMALLYVSIIGFVIVIANTVVFQFQFSQKTKVIYMHVPYFLIFMMIGIVNRCLSQYNNSMEELSSYNILSANCTSRQYTFECSLSGDYVDYNQKIKTFFIVQTIFTLIFIVAYHIAALYQFKDLQHGQSIKQQGQGIKQEHVQNSSMAKNETFISEADIN